MARSSAILSGALGALARLFVATLLALGAVAASANTAITVPPSAVSPLVPAGAGFNYYQGSYSLGWTFVPGTNITVTALGFYDDLLNGLAQSHPVGIYDKATGALLTSITVAPTDTRQGFFLYATLASPVTLTAGNTYVLMAVVLSEQYLAFANVDPLWTVDPAITYTGSAVNYANPTTTVLLLPDTYAPTGGDFGPNFLFTAAAAGPIATLSPSSLSFAPQGIGTTSGPQVVTLTNTGSAALNISAITTTGDFATSSTCSVVLAPAASCTLTVNFTPLVAGARTGAITISDSAPGSPRTVTLQGTGASGAAPSVSVPASVSFPPAQVGGFSAPVDVSVFNMGAGDLLVAVAQIVGGDFVIVRDGCTNVPVPPDTDCLITVLFVPSAAGQRLSSLRIISNDPAGPAIVTLSGTGTAAPTGTLTAVPDALAFTDRVTGTASAPQAVTVTNIGTVPVNVSSVDLAGDFSQTNDCVQLAPAGTCTIAVVFRPTVTGLRTATLTVLSDASDPLLRIGLSGRGTLVPAPVIQLSVTGLAFGNRLMGAKSGAQEVILGNVGGADLAIGGFGITNDFLQANNCPAVVIPGATCRISVNFSPSVPGDRTGKLSVQSNAVSGNSSVDLAGKGCRIFSLRGSRIPTLSCQ